ncbi:MAG: LeuA family protein [Terriglobales bacterium]
MKTIEVMDTTLRDGEQTPGVNYTADEKLIIAEALLRSGIDAVEVGSALISEGEADAVRRITQWARSHDALDKIEVLGFVDGTRSADWIAQNGCRTLNLLTKGSEHHCRVQLKKTPEQHLQDIERTVTYAHKNGLTVNVYLEDWSQGMRDCEDYVMALTAGLAKLPIKRVMLCDTLGVLTPHQTEEYVRKMHECFKLRFDFHGHNDYGLAVANSIFAVRAGAGRIHVAMNGLGERAGNTNLATLVVTARDLYGLSSNVNERALAMLSDLVAGISGVEPSANAPIVGRISAIQGCGVHADGDKKGKLYQNRLDPTRFGRKRSYDLGKTAGLASIEHNCKELGIEITPEQQRALLAKVKELGDQKVTVTQADIILLLHDIFSAKENGIKLLDYHFTLKKGAPPKVALQLCHDKRKFEARGEGDGQYDAFIKALRSVYADLPELVDYRIGISRKGTSGALTEATITWRTDGKLFTTRAVNPDQLVAAMNATMRMLNYIEFKRELSKAASAQT